MIDIAHEGEIYRLYFYTTWQCISSKYSHRIMRVADHNTSNILFKKAEELGYIEYIEKSSVKKDPAKKTVSKKVSKKNKSKKGFVSLF